MLKLLGSILIVGASAALGLAVRQHAVVKVRVLAEWIDCINLLILEIGQRNIPLQEAFLVIAGSRNRLVGPFFYELSKQISGLPVYDFSMIWRKSLKRFWEDWGLQQEEQEILLGIAEYLGRYDSAAQTQCLETAMLRLRACRDHTADELRSNKSLYRTCGAAAGILLVLVLI